MNQTNVAKNRLFKCGVGFDNLVINPFGEVRMCLGIDYPKFSILETSLQRCWLKLKQLVDNILPNENYKCNACEFRLYCKWCPGKAWLENRSFTSCVPECKQQAACTRKFIENRKNTHRRQNQVYIRTWGGIGDGLLATPAIRELKKQNPKLRIHCIINKNHKELFENNPYIDYLTILPDKPFPKNAKAQFFCLNYGKFKPSVNCDNHAVDIIASMINVKLKNRKIDIFFTEEDENFAKNIVQKYNNAITLQIKSFCSDNNDWFLDRWEKTIARLKDDYAFIQLGSKGEPLVRGAIDMLGKTTVRQAAALVKYSKLFLGVASFLSHTTNAVGTPAVILFGASCPKIWGYDHNINIYKELECSPCIDTLGEELCSHRKCMRSITVEEVVNAVKRVVGNKHNFPKEIISVR